MANCRGCLAKKHQLWFYREPNEKRKNGWERLQSFDFIPEYFVITNFDEYEQRHRLRAFLIQDCNLFAESDRFHFITVFHYAGFAPD
jgi:hypothetical protein